jgi:hypothetical protein
LAIAIAKPVTLQILKYNSHLAIIFMLLSASRQGSDLWRDVVIKNYSPNKGKAIAIVAREKSEAMSCRLLLTLAQTQNIGV